MSKFNEKLLEVSNIEVVYNHVILVLKGVSLSLSKGSIVALLGGNGAGKTTTLKAISNLLHSERGEVTKGSITYRNEKIEKLNPSDLVRSGRNLIRFGQIWSQSDPIWSDLVPI